MATMAALILANTPMGGDIASFWEEPMTLLSVGDFDLTESIGHWINDGLMAVFFVVDGLEIKRELVTGELHDPRTRRTAGDRRDRRDGDEMHAISGPLPASTR